MITRKTSMLSRQARNKGFTLTEIAIVLGIVGLILGAIWVAASSVYANQKAAKTNTSILTVVQAVRSLYSTSSTLGDAAGTDETGAFINAGVFPSDLISGANVYTPWGSTTSIMVTSQKISTDGDAFMVELNKIPTAGCINLITSITGSGRDPGLLYANATTAAKGAATVTLTSGSLALPVTASAANAACAAAAAVSIQFGFKLKG